MFNMSRTVGQCVLGIADSHHQICDGPAHCVLHTHTASSMCATPDYDSTLSSAINAKQTGASGTLVKYGVYLSARAGRDVQAEQSLIDSAKAHVRLHMQGGAGLPLGGSQCLHL